MSRRAASFRESDVVRAVKAARKAGLCVTGIVCHPDGSIETKAETPVAPRTAPAKHEPEPSRWEDVET